MSSSISDDASEPMKSPDEVCSFLLHYINTLPPTVTKLLLFSDGAAGQNKNHTVVRLLMALCDTGRYEFIRHYFPVRGHSFLPCDRDFGSIQRLIRRADRIYTPEQYGELFVRASRTKRFSIHYVKTEEILAFKSWWPGIYKKTTISDETMGRGIAKEHRESFMISKYKEFEYTKEKMEKWFAKSSFQEWYEALFLKKKNTPTPHSQDLPSAKAHPAGKVAINEKKIQDIL